MLGLSADDADRKPAFPNHRAATRLAGDVALASPAGGVGRALARPCQRQSTTADAGRRRLARRGRQSGGGLHRTSSVLAFCCGGGVCRHLEPVPRASGTPLFIVAGSDRRAWAARLGRLGLLAPLARFTDGGPAGGRGLSGLLAAAAAAAAAAMTGGGGAFDRVGRGDKRRLSAGAM